MLKYTVGSYESNRSKVMVIGAQRLDKNKSVCDL